MQITVGAKCWDGSRSKSLSNLIKVEGLTLHLVERVTFKDRLRRLNDPKLKALLGYAVPIAFLINGLPPFGITRAFAQTVTTAAPFVSETVPAMAVMSDAFKGKILHAFDPLINLIQSLSYPIAGVMIAGGCLFIMVGNREKGMQMLQNAAIGYILVQLSPMILELLVGIGGHI
ncbi:hypothetical protein PAECIP111891_03178 [Paenibacillus allorhizoplanae]|uniref:YIP1 family protein n=1 Tax=Paenibacillus allorhizoplanae TaxID=2905648 RepID=A0ABM9CBS0_9BACL|nr:hypothetical protein [Paenibacillus allorhizoplanae]CAH1208219.1 hypothetical protein PAECIP111891_03178 [Paenibacillus allorhizoplanae]